MIRQLHYTSCRHGRDGIQGFQVAAATPDIPARHEDRALPLAAYRPPPSTPAAPAPAEVDALPVALGFRDFGEVAVLFRSRYLGEDFSGRQGNYFAHVLLLDRPGRDLAGIVPALTWDADFWTREPVDDGGTFLAPLDDLHAAGGTGPLGRGDGAGPWIAGHRADFAALLAAVRDGLAGRLRRVVVVADGPAPDAEAAAAIAAVTSSLPGRLGTAVSFTTFCSTPDDVDLLVVGTTLDVALRPEARDRVLLRLGAVGPGPGSAFEELIVERWRAGRDAVEALHGLTTQIRPALTVDELDAFAAAVPLLDGDADPGPDPLTGLEFLAHRHPRALTAPVWARVEAAFSAGSAPVDDLDRWSAVLGCTSGDRKQVEAAYLRAVLARLAGGDEADGLWLPPVDTGSADRATAWALHTVTDDPLPGTALRVLRTLARLGIEPPDADLAEISDLVLLPLVLDPDGDVEPFRALPGSGRLCGLMAAQLEERLDDEVVGTVAEGMTVEAAQWLGDAAAPHGRVALATALRLAAAGRRDPVGLVVGHAVDAAALDRLVAVVWPAAPPTVSEGLRLLADLDPAVAVAGMLPGRLAQRLVHDAADEQSAPRAEELARALAALPPGMLEQVRAQADAVLLTSWFRAHPLADPAAPAQVRAAARAGRLADPTLGRPLIGALVHRLFEADAVLHAQSLKALLDEAPPDLRPRYEERLSRTLEAAEPAGVLAVLPTLAHLSASHPAAVELLHGPAAEALARRRRRVLDELTVLFGTPGSVPYGLAPGRAANWTMWWRSYRQGFITPAEPGLRDRILRFGRGS